MPRKEPVLEPHTPTDESIATVQGGAALGTPRQDIAKMLGITVGQLEHHYRKILETAPARADQAVARNLYEQASKGKGPGAIKAAKEWLNRGKGDPAADQEVNAAELAEYLGITEYAVKHVLAAKGQVIRAGKSNCFYLRQSVHKYCGHCGSNSSRVG